MRNRVKKLLVRVMALTIATCSIAPNFGNVVYAKTSESTTLDKKALGLDTSYPFKFDTDDIKAADKVIASIQGFSKMSDMQKLGALRHWVGSNVRYSASASVRPYDVLTKKKGMCVGYSNALILLASRIGIKGKVIGNINHAICMFLIEGKWYFVEPQSSGFADNESELEEAIEEYKQNIKSCEQDCQYYPTLITGSVTSIAYPDLYYMQDDVPEVITEEWKQRQIKETKEYIAEYTKCMENNQKALDNMRKNNISVYYDSYILGSETKKYNDNRPALAVINLHVKAAKNGKIDGYPYSKEDLDVAKLTVNNVKLAYTSSSSNKLVVGKTSDKYNAFNGIKITVSNAQKDTLKVDDSKFTLSGNSLTLLPEYTANLGSDKKVKNEKFRVYDGTASYDVTMKMTIPAFSMSTRKALGTYKVDSIGIVNTTSVGTLKKGKTVTVSLEGAKLSDFTAKVTSGGSCVSYNATSGKLTGKKAGTAKITFTAKGNKNCKLTLTVKVK